MRILSTTFKILNMCGCWRPESWSSPLKKRIYSTYTVLVTLLVFTFTLSQFLDLLLNVDSVEDFADNIYTLLAMLIGCCKMTEVMRNKKKILILLSMLAEEPFRPASAEEWAIYDRLENLVRLTTLHYAFSIEVSIAVFTVVAYFIGFRKTVLTFRGWLPYNYSSPVAYTSTFLHQTVGWVMGSLLHIGADALLCGLLMHTYGQFDIVEYRLKQMKGDGYAEVRRCVRHHNRIYKFAIMINETFKLMIFIQFVVSTLVVCFTLIQLVKTKSLNSKTFLVVTYMAAMLLQIFLYCWCGNEVKTKSAQLGGKIFETDWTALDNATQKMLIMIMRRAREPIQFTSAYTVALTTESFVSVLKMSYSTYNLLQQSQQK